EDGIRDLIVTGVQTCALPISVVAGLVADHLAVTADDRRRTGHAGDLAVVERLEPAGAGAAVAGRGVAVVALLARAHLAVAAVLEIGRASCRGRGEMCGGGGVV